VEVEGVAPHLHGLGVLEARGAGEGEEDRRSTAVSDEIRGESVC
jgi:hypothetical protein